MAKRIVWTSVAWLTAALAQAQAPAAQSSAASRPPAEVPAAEVPAAEVPAAEVPAAEVPAAEVPIVHAPGEHASGADEAPAAAPKPGVATPPGYPVQAAPRVEIVRTPLPPHRHLGGRHGPVPAKVPVPDYAAPRSKPRKQLVHSDGRLALGVGGVLDFSKDPGFRYAFDDHVQRGVDVFAACDVVRPVTGVHVAVGASVRRFAGEDRDSAVKLHALNATLDLSLRYDALPILPVFVRAGLGFARARLDVDAGADQAHGQDAAVIGQFGGGVVVQTAPGWFETYRGRLAKLSFGVTVEGGYTVGPALSPRFEAKSSLGIAQGYAQPGTLSSHAPYLRILATTRF